VSSASCSWTSLDKSAWQEWVILNNDLRFVAWLHSYATKFFSENVIAITVELAWMIQACFPVMGLYFHKFFVIFNTLLPALDKTLYTNVVKSPASTSERIASRKLCFSSLASAKWCPHSASVTGPNRWFRRVQDLGYEQDGENSPSHFCVFLTCSQAGVRPGIVVKEKDVFGVKVSTNSTDALSQFKVSLYRSWCAPKSRQGIIPTLVYSVSLGVGKNVLKVMETLWKNRLIIAKEFELFM
jgi:hypothetical protein